MIKYRKLKPGICPAGSLLFSIRKLFQFRNSGCLYATEHVRMMKYSLQACNFACLSVELSGRRTFLWWLLLCSSDASCSSVAAEEFRIGDASLRSCVTSILIAGTDSVAKTSFYRWHSFAIVNVTLGFHIHLIPSRHHHNTDTDQSGLHSYQSTHSLFLLDWV